MAAMYVSGTISELADHDTVFIQYDEICDNVPTECIDSKLQNNSYNNLRVDVLDRSMISFGEIRFLVTVYTESGLSIVLDKTDFEMFH